PASDEIEAASKSHRVFFATSAPAHELARFEVLELAPWCDDDLIEYLLCTNRDRCKSVMQRVRNDPDRGALCGNAQLWRIALDEMVADDSVLTCTQALIGHIDRTF